MGALSSRSFLLPPPKFRLSLPPWFLCGRGLHRCLGVASQTWSVSAVRSAEFLAAALLGLPGIPWREAKQFGERWGDNVRKESVARQSSAAQSCQPSPFQESC